MAGNNVITPEFRVSYPNVFRPGKPMEAGKEGKYSIVCLFPQNADLRALKAAVADVLTEKFGSKDNWPKKWRNPFRDQGEKESVGYEAGAVFITATAKTKPGVVDAKTSPILDEANFYAGCYARAQVRPYYYDQNGNKGVAFGLQHVMKTRDGESLDGRMKASEAFKEFVGGETEGEEEDLFA